MWEGAKALFTILGALLLLFIVLAAYLLLKGKLEVWCDDGGQVACLFYSLLDALL
jgi:hypothetical protein